MEGLSSSDLIAAARARGYKVTLSQLERWRQAGLIPAARRRGRGKGAGVAWIHPEIARDQLLTLLEIRCPREPIAELAVRLWLRKFDVPMPKLQEHLANVLEIFPRLRRQVRERGVVGFGEAFADMLRRTPSKRAAYAIEHLDREGYDRASGIGEAVAAQFDGITAAPTEEQAALIEAAMKVSATEQSIIDALGANFKDEIRNAMPVLSRGEIRLQLSSINYLKHHNIRTLTMNRLDRTSM